MEVQKEPIYNHIFFPWLVLNLLSFVFIFNSQHLAQFIGLFVPFNFGYGEYLLAFLVSLKGFAAFFLLIVSFVYADRLALKLKIIDPLKRLLYNLLWLFLLTLIINLLMWGHYSAEYYLDILN